MKTFIEVLLRMAKIWEEPGTIFERDDHCILNPYGVAERLVNVTSVLDLKSRLKEENTYKSVKVMTMVHLHTWLPGLLRVLVLRSTHVVTHIINGCFGVLAKKHPLVWVEHSWLLSVVKREVHQTKPSGI